MTRIGGHMGAKLTQSRKLGLILPLSFLLGVAVTVAEPDLQVLAVNVPAIDSLTLILAVSLGVGLFLALCMARIVFALSLRLLLMICYGFIFLSAAFSDPELLSVAFDSGGVTTGPMTVPFIMALGVGVASIRSDENAKADSFGLVGLCSVGPVAAVLLLEKDCQGDAMYEQADGLLRDRSRREEMVRAQNSIALPDAGEKIYQTLREIMEARRTK